MDSTYIRYRRHSVCLLEYTIDENTLPRYKDNSPLELTKTKHRHPKSPTLYAPPIIDTNKYNVFTLNQLQLSSEISKTPQMQEIIDLNSLVRKDSTPNSNNLKRE